MALNNQEHFLVFIDGGDDAAIAGAMSASVGEQTATAPSLPCGAACS